jgi:peptide subunit release factor 1 (eRF1)
MTMLKELSALTDSEHPVLSVYLDWSVDSTGQRQSLATLEQELDRITGELEVRGAARESFDADRERISQYLAVEAPRDASGIVIFASQGQGLWQPIPLMVPVETTIALDGTPHLYQLARLLDDHETFAVAVAEGQQAQIFVVSLETMEQVDSTQAREEVQRVDVGGWSQLRYQRHTGFVIQLHMNDLASALQETVERHNAEHLVILTNDSVKGHIRSALPKQLTERVVDMLPYERSHEPEQLFSQLDPLMREVERQQEQELLERLETQLATKGGLAFAGELSIAHALHKGQIDTLLLSASYVGGTGSECVECGSLWPGQLESCPYDGGELRRVDFREGLVRHTLRQGGRIEVLGIEGALEQHGGVAAILRFRDDVGQEVGGVITGDGIA